MILGRYVHYSVFLVVVVVKSIIWCLSCDVDESIIWCFSHGSCWSPVLYCTCTWMLFARVKLHIEMNLTRAWGREDYMCIGDFYDVQVVESIPWTLIGCQPRVAMLACIYTSPLIDILSYSPLYFCLPAKCYLACWAGESCYYFILHIRAEASSGCW